MAWYLYSTEEFPSKKSGRAYEFIEALGQRFAVSSQSTTKLKGRYEIFRHEDWQDDTGHRYPVFPEELAKTINEKYGFRGIFVTDHEPDSDEFKKLVAKAHKLNLKWRQAVVENFERNIARVRMGKPGRTEPTVYEEECYAALGLNPPSSLDELKAKSQPAPAQTIQVVLTPELIQAIRAMPQEQAEQLQAKTPTEKLEPLVPETLEDAKRIVRNKHL